jgi:hypothetical protein
MDAISRPVKTTGAAEQIEMTKQKEAATNCERVLMFMRMVPIL